MLKQISIGCAIVLLCNATMAQANISSHSMAVSLQNAIEVTFTTGTNGVNMSFTTANHYSSGRTTGNSNLRVRSNKRFNVAVKAASANFNTNSSTPMPVTNVLYVRRGSQAYINLSTTDQNIVTNAQRGIRNYNINYKATPGFNYDAGTYSVQVIYTATQL